MTLSKINHGPQVNITAIDIHNKRCTVATKLAKKMIRDFNQFKISNELNNCTMSQSKPTIENSIEVTWKTEKRYDGTLIDVDVIQRDFNNFAEFNENELCQISNMYCKDDKYIVEYSIHRIYKTHFVFHEEKTDE